jgi:hypothetical protein
MVKISERIAALRWEDVLASLWGSGYGRLGTLLTAEECGDLSALYGQPELFRSRIDMARYRFGRGEYQYFAWPLPALVGELRAGLYRHLAPAANEWMAALGFDQTFPASLDGFQRKCAASGQTRPTPLLLRYRAGDFNCLHQDLYGEVVFPFQVVFGLSKPREDYDGGEFLLVEQQPRAQSAGHALLLEQGEGVVITTRYRPVRGKKGFYRTNVRHGVSPVRAGERYTLGIVFHDAA